MDITAANVNLSPDLVVIGEKSVPTTKSKAGQKRGPDSLQYTEDDLEYMAITDTCNQIRRKINTFIDNGGMKVGEFRDAINVTGNSYYTLNMILPGSNIPGI